MISTATATFAVVAAFITGAVLVATFGYAVLGGGRRRRHRLQRVENKNRRFGAADHYYRLRWFDTDGDVRTFLLTADEMSHLMRRAATNREDLDDGDPTDNDDRRQ